MEWQIYHAVDCQVGGFPYVEDQWMWNLGPAPYTWYPEYMTDYHIAECPSNVAETSSYFDQTNSLGEETGPQYCTAATDPIQGDDAEQNGWWTPQATAFLSYTYTGYVFDKASNSDTLTTTDLAGRGWGECYADGVLVPGQIPAFFDARGRFEDDLWITTGEGTGTFEQSRKHGLAWDPDLPLLDWMADWYGDGTPLGNGGSNTIYRIREGIARFMITDINNPGASALAESEIAALWDDVSTKNYSFNHKPGGANVLFMDGHVAFQKYPGEDFPTNYVFAMIYGGGNCAP